LKSILIFLHVSRSSSNPSCNRKTLGEFCAEGVRE
jgi:hypothetical protein